MHNGRSLQVEQSQMAIGVMKKRKGENENQLFPKSSHCLLLTTVVVFTVSSLSTLHRDSLEICYEKCG